MDLKWECRGFLVRQRDVGLLRSRNGTSGIFFVCSTFWGVGGLRGLECLCVDNLQVGWVEGSRVFVCRQSTSLHVAGRRRGWKEFVIISSVHLSLILLSIYMA